MPLNGNTYVAPVWRNGQPPALDPTELQAISDSIVRNQTDNAEQDSLIAALQTAVSALQTGKAQIEVGSYVGTGTYGASNPCSITCSFVPKVIAILSYGDQLYFGNINSYNASYFVFCDVLSLTTSYVLQKGFCRTGNMGYATAWAKTYGKKSSDGHTMYWYNTDNANDQFNGSGTTTRWMSIG